jgi:hypothetical protein
MKLHKTEINSSAGFPKFTRRRATYFILNIRSKAELEKLCQVAPTRDEPHIRNSIATLKKYGEFVVSTPIIVSRYNKYWVKTLSGRSIFFYKDAVDTTKPIYTFPSLVGLPKYPIPSEDGVFHTPIQPDLLPFI